MNARQLFPFVSALFAFGGISAAQDAEQKANQTDARISREVTVRADSTKGQGQSNEKGAQPKRIEDSYPLTSDADREKSAKILQQLTVDLLSLFNQHKEAHWNVNGPLYLPLHEFYQEQADFYRTSADTFAERVLHLGYSVDGRYSTVARTSGIPDFPAGYVTDNESIKLLLDRVTVLQKEVYRDIRETEKSDPPTSNKLQDLAYAVDKNLWQLRIHLKKPGGLGEDLPWVTQQGRDRSGK
ncbi:MAG: DNA starvation/stationary phase protection protein [Chthonomonadaceae bacterium]|nr:DNA starvation/stationary phase protection protein [Chthonomonadaceae bacterium]